MKPNETNYHSTPFVLKFDWNFDSTLKKRISGLYFEQRIAHRVARASPTLFGKNLSIIILCATQLYNVGKGKAACIIQRLRVGLGLVKRPIEVCPTFCLPPASLD
jgi:hypothetical protein